MSTQGDLLDLLVVGAGPTGIAIGAAARQAGLDALLVDRRGLCGSLRDFPNDMFFFTTRDKLEIADMPFGIPDDKPTRRQALAYYQGVARRYQLRVAGHEDVAAVEPLAAPDADGARFRVLSRVVDEAPGAGRTVERRARAVALAQGYFARPKSLGVPGEDLPFVAYRYREPDGHFGEHVLVVGGGNSAAETALDLWRHGANVTVVHHRAAVKKTIKYWVKPDFENRIEEKSITAFFDSEVRAIAPDGQVTIDTPEGTRTLQFDAVYVLIGYHPELQLAREAGVVLGEDDIPRFDPATCETGVAGLYIAGTLQAGRFTDRIFIENSRDHGPKIAAHLASRLGR